MFKKLKTARYLKATASADSATVQFDYRVQRLARVHQYGLQDRGSRRDAVAKYAERRLLGINDTLEIIAKDILIRWLQN